MRSTVQVSCPHCETRLQLAPEQQEQAGGKVRCGKCLHVFDASSGEIEFVVPTLPEEDATHPLAAFTVKTMDAALLPPAARAVSIPALLLLCALMLALAAQVFLWQQQVGSAASVLHIEQLVVRKHPNVEGALRLDAILSNTGSTATPMPALELRFSTRYGEARAQRLFLPAEYLHGDYRGVQEIAAYTEMQVSLSLQDPGHDAINFNARLRSVIKPAY